MAQTQSEILPPRYRSVEAFAHGGMGEIYKATDTALGREVAVKVLAQRYARDAALRTRFRREALAAARLSGEPHTVTIFDVGEWNDRPYIVMELASGGTVGDRIDEGRTDVSTSLGWLEQAAAALDAAHARGVVHRDVKPANLLLAEDGGIRVADFGIASAAGLTSVTATGTVLGTLGYLAPEQALGRETGPEADRYSLAVVAYELLAGQRPYETGSGPAEAAAAIGEPIPAISRDRPGLPAGLDPIFRRALAKDGSDRYPSGAEFVGELRRAFEDDAGTTRAWTAPAVPPVGRDRARWLPWLVGLALLAAGAIAATLLLGRTAPSGETTGIARPPVVRTVTARGETVTVTAPAPPAPAPTTAGTSPATSTAPPATTTAATSGAALNDAGWRRMQAGDYRGALPLLEQATAKLSGTGSLSEAYALYNLAFTRYTLGACDGVLALLDRSEAIQGDRSEIDSLRAQATKSCDGFG